MNEDIPCKQCISYAICKSRDISLQLEADSSGIVISLLIFRCQILKEWFHIIKSKDRILKEDIMITQEIFENIDI